MSLRTDTDFENDFAAEKYLLGSVEDALLGTEQQALPPSARAALKAAGRHLAPQPQRVPQERWVRLWRRSLDNPRSLGFVRVDGTAGLGQLLTGKREGDQSNVGSRLLKSWESARILRSYWKVGHGRKPKLMGVNLPHATEAARWVSDRRSWAVRPSTAPRRPPISEGLALKVVCEALAASEYPPDLYTTAEALQHLAQLNAGPVGRRL